jgi:hypothetical protein
MASFLHSDGSIPQLSYRTRLHALALRWGGKKVVIKDKDKEIERILSGTKPSIPEFDAHPWRSQ